MEGSISAINDKPAPAAPVADDRRRVWVARLRWLGRNLVVAGGYYALGRLGLLALFHAGNVSPAWPASGFALAAVIGFGPSMWPGILLGTLLVNAGTGAPWWVCLVMGLGNTGEALLASWLLRRFSQFRPNLERLQDVVGLLVFGSGMAALVSAVCGVGALVLAGIAKPEDAPLAALMWWTGNGMGILLITPLLLLPFASDRRSASTLTWPQMLGLVVSVTLVTSFVYGLIPPLAFIHVPIYVVFPALVWAALRFGPAGGLASSVVVTVIGVVCTARGAGPFLRATTAEGFLAEQLFAWVVTLTALLVGAAGAERRRAVELRDEFISIASHELRTPLTTLNLGLYSAKRGASKETLLVVATMQGQLDRLVRLVDEMLDISRMVGGRLVLDLEPLELTAIVRTVAARLQEDLEHARCPLLLDIDVPIRLSGDRRRLEQVTANLLQNALKYGAGKPVELRVRRSGSSAVLVVRDLGIGIPHTEHQRIFQRFERAVSDRSYGGLGLGLYIVGQVVDAHGGSIKLDSAPGAGASFTVRLPLEDELTPA